MCPHSIHSPLPSTNNMLHFAVFAAAIVACLAKPQLKDCRKSYFAHISYLYHIIVEKDQ